MKRTVFILLWSIALTVFPSCNSYNLMHKKINKNSMGAQYAKMLYVIPKDGQLSPVERKHKIKVRDRRFLKNSLNQFLFILKDVTRSGYADNAKKKQSVKIPFFKVAIDQTMPEDDLATKCSQNRVRISPSFFDKVVRKSINSIVSDSAFRFNMRIRTENQFLHAMFYFKAQRSILRDLLSSNWDNEDEEGMDIFELTQLNASLNQELLKIMLFTLGHEYYHRIAGCQNTEQEEIDADYFGYLLCRRAFGWGEYIPIFSRSTDELIRDIYTGERILNGDAIHPPLEKRLEYITNFSNKKDSLFIADIALKAKQIINN